MRFLTRIVDRVVGYDMRDVRTPLNTRVAYAFNMRRLRSELRPIERLQEYSWQLYVVEIGGTQLRIPQGWHILVADRETGDVDVVPIESCSGQEWHAVGVGTGTHRRFVEPVRVLRVEHGVEAFPLYEGDYCLMLDVGGGTGLVVAQEDTGAFYTGVDLGLLFSPED